MVYGILQVSVIALLGEAAARTAHNGADEDLWERKPTRT